MTEEKISTTKVQILRKKRNITQEELAHKVGVTRQTIIAIEKGNYMPSVLLAIKLSRFFKKPVEYVFECNTYEQ